MAYQKSSKLRGVAVEALECRRLMDAAPTVLPMPWGDNAKLIRQDVALAQYPTITGQGQAIAILDTGIDYSRASLGAGFGPGHKVVGGWDFVDNDADPMDTFGHGTNVAGVIAAQEFEYNGFRYQGIAPGADLVALRVDAADDPVPAERMQAALQWVIDHRAELHIGAVNISLGDGAFSGDQTSIYSPQLLQLKKAGVMVCAASGNDGVGDPAGIEYPAADPSVFSVAAVDSFDRITGYSARAKNLDFLAPGDGIPTISPGPNDYEIVSGTSFASPMAAGLVALLKQVNPAFTVGDLTSLMKTSGVTNYDGDTEFGPFTRLKFPRLDMASALSLAQAWKPGPMASTGEIGKSTTSSMAYDGNGVLHFVYYDPSKQTMMYGVRLNSNAMSTPQIVDTTGVIAGQYLSLAIDPQGRPGIAYYDSTNADLRYAHFNGASWDLQTVDASGANGTFPSLAYTSNDHTLIAYYHRSKTALRLADFDGVGWKWTFIDSKDDVGRWASLAVSKSGEIAIAYEHSTTGTLRVARNAGKGWVVTTADRLTHGAAFISLAFNNINRPAISYYDSAPANLKFAEWDRKGWHATTLSSRGVQGMYTQLQFDSLGEPNIFYYSRRGNAVIRVRRTGQIWSAIVLQKGGGRFLTVAKESDGELTYTWFRDSDGKLLLGDLPAV
jgi:subtilisin family serine protease